MFREKSSLNKELSCYLCDKMTNVHELKAYPGGSWICADCSRKMFGNKKMRLEISEKPQQYRHINIVKEFDPYKEYEEADIKSTKSASQQPANIPIQASVEINKTVHKKPRSDKKLYKCTYCTFESRHYKDDDICPNCGRKRLVKVITTAELLKDMQKEPFFD